MSLPSSTKSCAQLIVVVIASKGELYDQFLQYWRKIAALSDPQRIVIKYVYNDPNLKQEMQEIGDDILVFRDAEILYPGIFNKTVKALQWFSTRYEYRYAVRTNLSSFYHFDNLLQYLSQYDSVLDFAGGVRLDHYGGFLSGAGMVLSRNVVTRLLQIPSTQYASFGVHDLPDDPAIGNMLRWLQVSFTHLPRVDFCDLQYFDTKHFEQMLQDRVAADPALDKVDSVFHVRVKNEYTPPDRLTVDTAIFKCLFARFYQSSISE